LSSAHGSIDVPISNTPPGTEHLGGQPAATGGGGGASSTGAPARQLVRREHRLVVLLLVLRDHPEREGVVDQLTPAVELHVVQDVHDLVPHLGHIGPRLAGRAAAARPIRARMLERVVQLVDVLAQRLAAADVADQPELLLVADVGVVPDQRRHQLGVLLDQVVGVDRVGQLHRPRRDRSAALPTKARRPSGDRSDS
jgi:hypothetical protein